MQGGAKMENVLVSSDLLDIVAAADKDGLMAGREIFSIKVIRPQGDRHVFEEIPTTIRGMERPEDAIGYRVLLSGQGGTRDVFAVIGEDKLTPNPKTGCERLELVHDPKSCFQYVYGPYVIPK